MLPEKLLVFSGKNSIAVVARLHQSNIDFLTPKLWLRAWKLKKPWGLTRVICLIDTMFYFFDISKPFNLQTMREVNAISPEFFRSFPVN